MKGLFGMLGIDESELKTSMAGFADLFERMKRMEQKLDEILEKLGQEAENGDDHD